VIVDRDLTSRRRLDLDACAGRLLKWRRYQNSHSAPGQQPLAWPGL